MPDPRATIGLAQAGVQLRHGDEVSYGKAPAGQRGFREVYFNEVKDRIDASRVHFVGRVPYDTPVTLLRVSAVHVYLTVPFVLSWSMLEAMSLRGQRRSPWPRGGG